MAKIIVKSSAKKVLKSETIGAAIRAKVAERGSNPRRLSAEIGYAYDHVRKVYNGSDFPGDALLKVLCDHLGLDYDVLLEAKNAEKAINSGAVETLLDEDVLYSKMKIYWGYLSQEQRDKIYNQVIQLANSEINKGQS